MIYWNINQKYLSPPIKGCRSNFIMCDQNLNKVKKIVLVMTRVADNASLTPFLR